MEDTVHNKPPEKKSFGNEQSRVKSRSVVAFSSAKTKAASNQPFLVGFVFFPSKNSVDASIHLVFRAETQIREKKCAQKKECAQKQNCTKKELHKKKNTKWLEIGKLMQTNVIKPRNKKAAKINKKAAKSGRKCSIIETNWDWKKK